MKKKLLSIQYEFKTIRSDIFKNKIFWYNLNTIWQFLRNVYAKNLVDVQIKKTNGPKLIKFRR